MRTALLTAIVVLGLAGAFFAQTATPPYTTANKLAWLAPDNATTAAIAQGLEYHFTATAGPAPGSPTAIAGVNVTGVTCTGTAQPFTCTALLQAGWLPILNALGQKNLTLFGLDVTGGGGQGPASVPFVSKVPPTAPSILGIQ